MDNQGYLLLKNALNHASISRAMKCINGQQVNYMAMTAFINDIMLPTVHKTSGIKLTPMKYRVSDNNNSVDAGALHRDVFSVNAEHTTWLPFITCVTYLDRTTLELIPGSWKEPAMSIYNAITRFSDRQQVVLEPGDILIFYATLLHRGIFTEKLQHRRLIQVFDCIPNDNLQMKNQVMHIPGDERLGNTMINLSRNNITAPILNFLGYLNAATGQGCVDMNKDSEFLNNCVPPSIQMFSSEGLCSRLSVVENQWQPINKYIILMPTIDMQEKSCQDHWRYLCFTRQYIHYAIVISVVLTILILLLIIGFRLFFKRKARNQVKRPRKR